MQCLVKITLNCYQIPINGINIGLSTIDNFVGTKCRDYVKKNRKLNYL